MRRPEYDDPRYRQARRLLREELVICRWCGKRRALTIDHEPGLRNFPPGQWVGRWIPACRSCNSARGGASTKGVRGRRGRRRTRRDVSRETRRRR